MILKLLGVLVYYVSLHGLARLAIPINNVVLFFMMIALRPFCRSISNTARVVQVSAGISKMLIVMASLFFAYFIFGTWFPLLVLLAFGSIVAICASGWEMFPGLVILSITALSRLILWLGPDA